MLVREVKSERVKPKISRKAAKKRQGPESLKKLEATPGWHHAKLVRNNRLQIGFAICSRIANSRDIGYFLAFPPSSEPLRLCGFA